MLKASTGDEVTINRKGKAMFGAKVREVVIATNNVVADADKKPMIGSKIATELPVVIPHLLSR